MNMLTRFGHVWMPKCPPKKEFETAKCERPTPPSPWCEVWWWIISPALWSLYFSIGRGSVRLRIQRTHCMAEGELLSAEAYPSSKVTSLLKSPGEGSAVIVKNRGKIDTCHLKLSPQHVLLFVGTKRKLKRRIAFGSCRFLVEWNAKRWTNLKCQNEMHTGTKTAGTSAAAVVVAVVVVNVVSILEPFPHASQ